MPTTLSARTDLTYEEICEAYAGGSSRLPKIIKEIENGNVALAESTGVEIKRRRTVSGNATNVANIGQVDTTVVAKLISAARWNALVAGYSGPGGQFITPPSYNMQTVNVRAVVKNPFDLIDQVAGINYANQARGAGIGVNLSGREAKMQEKGTGARIRDIDFRAPVGGGTADVDVRDYYPNDRIGSGGATGEIHGVDQGIQEVIQADSESVARGNATSPWDLTGNPSIDNNLKFKLAGHQIDAHFREAANVGVQEAVAVINTAVEAEAAANLHKAALQGDSSVAIIAANGDIELHSKKRGSSGTAIDINNVNVPMDIDNTDDVASGATVGDIGGTIYAQAVINLSSAARGAQTTLRYGTCQFGVLQIVGTTNGLTAATPSAYIVHPDFLEDLIAYQ